MIDTSEIQEKEIFVPDERTKRIAGLLLEILEIAKRENRKLFLDGGFALEIEAASKRGDNRLTRNHCDLDLHPLEEDIPFWKKWFLKRGFVLGVNYEIKDNTKAFVAHSPGSEYEYENENSNDFYIDMYGVKVGQRGELSSGESGKRENWGTVWQELIVPSSWDGLSVNVMKHEAILSNKRSQAKREGTSLREKDIHDHKLFGVSY